MRISLLIIVVLLVCSPVYARTWYVEKDGSGDYSVIQDAVDAAASQDTIRIGLGRFNDWETYGPGYYVFHSRIHISQPVLTILGSGADVTIIGPEDPWDQDQADHQGLSVTEDFSVLHIKNIGFENLNKGIFASMGDLSTIKHCKFSGIRISLALGTRSSVVEDCSFNESLKSGSSVLSYFQEEIVISRCTSETSIQWSNNHIQIEGPSNVFIDQCVFRGAFGGITFSRGPNAIIKSCTFEDQPGLGIYLGTGSPSCKIADCIFRHQGRVFLDSVFPGSEFKIERTIVEDVSYATVVGNWLGKGYIRDCILAKGSHGVVTCQSFPEDEYDNTKDELVVFDMKNNWWGTTDPDSIRAWIRDAGDDDRIDFIIDFEPFKSDAVATEKKSMGDVRALFR